MCGNIVVPSDFVDKYDDFVYAFGTAILETRKSREIEMYTGFDQRLCTAFHAYLKGNEEKAIKHYIGYLKHVDKERLHTESMAVKNAKRDNSALNEIVEKTGMEQLEALNMLNDYTRTEILAGHREDGKWIPKDILQSSMRINLTSSSS